MNNKRKISGVLIEILQVCVNIGTTRKLHYKKGEGNNKQEYLVLIALFCDLQI